MDVNEGDTYHTQQPLPKGLQIKKAARAVRAGGSHRQVDFTVFSDVDALNDVEFGVGFGVVGVSPPAQHACNTALEVDVLSSHVLPSVLVLDQVFGVVEA